MQKIYLARVLESRFCKIVFVLSFVGSFFLIPAKVFSQFYIILAVAFMFSFSLVVACLVRSIKDRVVSLRNHKHSALGIIAAVLGLSAFQVCGVGVPVCTASIGMWLLYSIFPPFFVTFLTQYSILIIAISILLQLISLYFMKCFKKVSVAT